MGLQYQTMNRTELDKAYNNTQAIDNFPEVYANFQQRSQQTYSTLACARDIFYHDKERTRLDFFDSGINGAPTLIFIHGGYWQNCTKEDFAFIAEGPIKNGINVILVEYTLAPEASMTQIVGEIGIMLDFLRHNASRFKLTEGKICLSGHSAGGHLTALHSWHPLISHAMPISALVDLRPISLCWLNDKLQLTELEIESFSPVQLTAGNVPTQVCVGGSELPELIEHSRLYYQHLLDSHIPAEYLAAEGKNHFSLLEQLSSDNGAVTQALLRLLSTE